MHDLLIRRRCIVAGNITREDDCDIGARPGQLLRGRC